MAKIARHAASSMQQVVADVDLLGEIFKHLDAETLAVAACVGRNWNQAASSEALWESICTRQWPCVSPRDGRLEVVVSALGGFRRFYLKCLHPLLSQSPSFASRNRSKSSSSLPWSKDAVLLSLSLFSVECYERHLAPAQALLESSSKARTTPRRPQQKAAAKAEYRWDSMDARQ